MPTADRLVAGGTDGPAVVVTFSLPMALYQTLAAMAQRQPVEGVIDPRPWESSVATIAPLLTPFGSLSLFEASLARTPSVGDVHGQLSERAAEITGALATALEGSERRYTETLWPAHRAQLEAGLADLRRLLVPHADALLARIARDLRLSKHGESYEVYLVPVTYQAAGGYSHPTVVSVDRFKRAQLLEAVLHELVHVMAGLNRHDPNSAIGVLKQQCAEAGLDPETPFRLFHQLVFIEARELVRDLVPGYTALPIPRRLQSLEAAAVWRARMDGRHELAQAARLLVEAQSSGSALLPR